MNRYLLLEMARIGEGRSPTPVGNVLDDGGDGGGDGDNERIQSHRY